MYDIPLGEIYDLPHDLVCITEDQIEIDQNSIELNLEGLNIPILVRNTEGESKKPYRLLYDISSIISREGVSMCMVMNEGTWKAYNLTR